MLVTLTPRLVGPLLLAGCVAGVILRRMIWKYAEFVVATFMPRRVVSEDARETYLVMMGAVLSVCLLVAFVVAVAILALG